MERRRQNSPAHATHLRSFPDSLILLNQSFFLSSTEKRNKKGNSSSPYFSGSYSPEPKHIVCVCVCAHVGQRRSRCVTAKVIQYRLGVVTADRLAANPLTICIVIEEDHRIRFGSRVLRPMSAVLFLYSLALTILFFTFFVLLLHRGLGKMKAKGNEKSSKWIFQESKEKRKKLEEQNVVFFHSSSSFFVFARCGWIDPVFLVSPVARISAWGETRLPHQSISPL